MFESTPTIVGVLIGINSLLIAAVTWLALWLRKLHNDSLKRMYDSREEMIRLGEKTADALVRSSKAVEDNARVIENNTKAINDLHIAIIRSTQEK